MASVSVRQLQFILSKIGSVIAVLIYSLCYQAIHILYLVPKFGYMGYLSNGFSTMDVIFTTILILLPLVVKPKKILFLEIAFAIFYLLLYVPIIITFLNHYQTTCNILYNQIFITLGFLIIFIIPKLKVKRPVLTSSRRSSTSFLLILIILLLVGLYIKYHGTYGFVSFDNVYEHRSETGSDSAIAGYIVLWVTYFLGPLVLVNGLVRKSKMLVSVGFFAIIFIYGISANKITIFIPFVIIGIYYMHKWRVSMLNTFSYIFSAFMILLVMVSDKLVIIAAVILMRTFGITGLLTYQYNEFFKAHQYTFFSHINIVNFITKAYPYKDELGFVVAGSYDQDSNSNANFMATDGIASLGLPGIIIIGVIIGSYFLFSKAQLTKSNETLIGLMFVPFCFIILNVGFFTSLLSGGLLFMNIYYLFKYPSKEKNSIKISV